MMSTCGRVFVENSRMFRVCVALLHPRASFSYVFCSIFSAAGIHWSHRLCPWVYLACSVDFSVALAVSLSVFSLRLSLWLPSWLCLWLSQWLSVALAGSRRLFGAVDCPVWLSFALGGSLEPSVAFSCSLWLSVVLCGFL